MIKYTWNNMASVESNSVYNLKHNIKKHIRCAKAFVNEKIKGCNQICTYRESKTWCICYAFLLLMQLITSHLRPSGPWQKKSRFKIQYTDV